MEKIPLQLLALIDRFYGLLDSVHVYLADAGKCPSMILQGAFLSELKRSCEQIKEHSEYDESVFLHDLKEHIKEIMSWTDVLIQSGKLKNQSMGLLSARALLILNAMLWSKLIKNTTYENSLETMNLLSPLEEVFEKYQRGDLLRFDDGRKLYKFKQEREFLDL